MCFRDPDIMGYRLDYAHIRKVENGLRDEDVDIQYQIRDLFQTVFDERDELVTEEYSEAVYDRFAKWRPLLRKKGTLIPVTWRKAFGTSFEATDKQQRYDMVGLIERDGRYRFYDPLRRLVYWDREFDRKEKHLRRRKLTRISS